MIKAAVTFSTIGLVSAFMTPTARQSGSSISMAEKSLALPMDARPANLPAGLPADAGFDPAGFSNNPPRAWLIGGEEKSLKWYREAEIVHGRIAQLAVIGMLFPSWYHFEGGALGVAPDAFAELNPYKAISTVPAAAWLQIAAAIHFVEIFRLKRVIRGEKEPGDLGLGQGGWNPFGFNYTPEEYFEKQTQELKHGRLAMFGIIGMLLQAKASGVGVVQQLSGSFNWPSEREILLGPGTLNDYFPPGL